MPRKSNHAPSCGSTQYARIGPFRPGHCSSGTQHSLVLPLAPKPLHRGFSDAKMVADHKKSTKSHPVNRQCGGSCSVPGRNWQTARPLMYWTLVFKHWMSIPYCQFLMGCSSPSRGQFTLTLCSCMFGFVYLGSCQGGHPHQVA